MKKILIAFDGKHFSEGALRFAAWLNENKPILLAGAFLPQVDYAGLWSYSGRMANLYLPLVEDEDSETVQKNIERFRNFCVKQGIEHRIHSHYADFTLPELKNESRFADLLIIGSETFYKDAGSSGVNEYLRAALHDVECPVIVVPEKYEFPESIILTYDGSESSVFAIKQFAYLFPELCDHKTILINLSEKEAESMPDQAALEELTARHFSDLTLLRLEAKPKSFFTAWLSERKNAIVVSGAYGRSALSRVFRKSFVASIISEKQLPVFIAHRK